MIAGSEKANFFVRQYEKIVLAVGACALVGGGVYFAMSLGEDVDAAKREVLGSLTHRDMSVTGVEKLDMSEYDIVKRVMRTPQKLNEIAEGQGSFLASDRRIKCKCGAVIVPQDACPACKASLVIINELDEATKKAEAWRARFKVEPDDTDSDGDGFTNAEEFAAGTDPTDGKDHPEYVDSLKLQLPLKSTFVPFVLLKGNAIPNGWRCEFFDAKVKDDYGRQGRTMTAVIGEEIGATVKHPTGYVLKSYEQKEERRAISGGKGMMKAVDVSVATVERKSDGKIIPLVVQPKKGAKLAPVDVQATLVYERGDVKTLEVVKGDTIDLSGAKYVVSSIREIGKGAEVVLENALTGKKHTIKTLD